MTLSVAARPSTLSKAQVKEIYEQLILSHPLLKFEITYISTQGDKDKKTSLRHLDKTDFFTQEIDQWVLLGKNRIGIHSAKDLPFPLATGLEIFCLTKGIDPSDSLVLRRGETLNRLSPLAKIATSSLRREEQVKQLRNDFTFCDLRGTIEERLQKMESGEVDGVVIAEAALIRLGFTDLNRIKIPGKTAQGQGQLAVVGREIDKEIKGLFSFMDVKQINA